MPRNCRLFGLPVSHDCQAESANDEVYQTGRYIDIGRELLT